MISGLSTIGCVLVGLVAAGLPRAPVVESGTPRAFSGPRVLHFPAERSLGRLSVQDANPVRRIESFHHWIDGTEWEYLGPAEGDVVVPAGQRLMLSHLAKLKSLEELELGGDKMTDAGLQHLAELPRLEYLLLWGRFSDAGIAHLKKLPALRTVNINIEQFGNLGMRHLSECPRLERIGVHWMENVTDEGLACLKDMPTLKKLDILHSQVTDAGLVHLSRIDSLDYLMLPGRVTETGLHHLRGLTGLKFLWVSGTSASTVGDRGLAALAGLQSLEELLIWGNGITDAGMDDLVKLGHLRKLTLTAFSQLTDTGLKKLTALKGLESLSLNGASISIAGLSFLNELPRLNRLDVKDVEQDGSGLDLSGLTHLEDLSLHLKRGRGADRAVSQAWREHDIAGLGRLTRLKRLQISHGGATDAALSHLTGLTRLERLSIGGDGVTDDGLAHVATLSNLNSLTLSGRFTDKALEYLQKLESLAFLDLKGAILSQAAVSRFQRDMPRLGLFQGYEIDYTIRPNPPAGGERR
jgi:Leucine-rich repeat (LRR) protein